MDFLRVKKVKSLRFRKLYADLITEEGTVCIVYQSWFDGLGLHRAYGAIELYWAEGKREVIRASIPLEPPDLGEIGSELEFCLYLPEGQFVLHYEVETGPWDPPDPFPCDGLHWAVKVAKANATGHWLGDNNRPELHGTGYADWVELNCGLRGLGLRSVDWGRMHFPDETIIFNAIHFRSGEKWKQMAQWFLDGKMKASSSFRIGRWNDSFNLYLSDQSAESESSVTIQPVRMLHSGRAIDARRFPNSLERRIVQTITGPIEETRWLSQATRQNGQSLRRGWTLHDWILFGLNSE